MQFVFNVCAQTSPDQQEAIANSLGLIQNDAAKLSIYRVKDVDTLHAFGITDIKKEDTVSFRFLASGKWQLTDIKNSISYIIPIDDPPLLEFDITNGQTLWARFTDISGISHSTDIVIKGGYPIGKVLRIELEQPTENLSGITFKVWMRIYEVLRLPQASTRIQIEQPLPVSPAKLVLFTQNDVDEDELFIEDLGMITTAKPQRSLALIDQATVAIVNFSQLGKEALEMMPKIRETLAQLDSLLIAAKSLGLGDDLKLRVNSLLDDTEKKFRLLTGSLTGDFTQISTDVKLASQRLIELVGNFDPQAQVTGGEKNTVAAFVYKINDVSRQLDEQLKKLAGSGSESVADTMQKINSALVNIESTVQSFKKIAEDIQPLVNADNIKSLNRSVADVEYIVERFATDIDSLLTNINGITWNLQNLTRSLKRNPNAIIFGKPREETR